MSLIQHDHVTQKFSAQRADEALDVRILPGTLVGGAHLQNAAGDQEGAHAVITVMEKLFSILVGALAVQLIVNGLVEMGLVSAAAH